MTRSLFSFNWLTASMLLTAAIGLAPSTALAQRAYVSGMSAARIAPRHFGGGGATYLGRPIATAGSPYRASPRGPALHGTGYAGGAANAAKTSGALNSGASKSSGHTYKTAQILSRLAPNHFGTPSSTRTTTKRSFASSAGGTYPGRATMEARKAMGKSFGDYVKNGGAQKRGLMSKIKAGLGKLGHLGSKKEKASSSAKEEQVVRNSGDLKRVALAKWRKNGDILGATAVLEKMKAQPNRGGVRGLVDRYRKWSTQRTLRNESLAVGKQHARQGHVEVAGQVAMAQKTLSRSGSEYDKNLGKIHGQAVKGAAESSRGGNALDAINRISFAGAVQKERGRDPSLGQRLATWNIKRRMAGNLGISNQMKSAAKKGDYYAVREMKAFLKADAKAGGKPLSDRTTKRLSGYEQTAKERYVTAQYKIAKDYWKGKRVAPQGHEQMDMVRGHLANAKDMYRELKKANPDLKLKDFRGARGRLGLGKDVSRKIAKLEHKANAVSPAEPVAR